MGKASERGRRCVDSLIPCSTNAKPPSFKRRGTRTTKFVISCNFFDIINKVKFSFLCFDGASNIAGFAFFSQGVERSTQLMHLSRTKLMPHSPSVPPVGGIGGNRRIIFNRLARLCIQDTQIEDLEHPNAFDWSPSLDCLFCTFKMMHNRVFVFGSPLKSQILKGRSKLLPPPRSCTPTCLTKLTLQISDL